MALRLNAMHTTELTPRIIVFGVGGAGGNAVNNMIEDQLQGVDFVVANTDSQALSRSKAERRIQIGMNTTQGLGAGANPNTGMAAAEESQDEIMEQLNDAHMVFITAGMGGGTGTGAAPIVAKIAREMGILTVAVVTKPFHFEGNRRMAMAEAGLAELQKNVDTLIVIPNQNLFRIANDKTTFQQAFQMADKVLHSGVRGITDLMIMPGLINLDFADVKSVLAGMGKAMMGTGEATGERRAIEAATAAINNPLLEDVSLKGARAVLIHVTGGLDMTLFELDEAANQVKSEVDPNANIIVGSTFDENMEGTIRVSVVASGIDSEEEKLAAAKNTGAQSSAPFQNKVTSPSAAPSQPATTAASHNTQQPVQVVRVTPSREAFNNSYPTTPTAQSTPVSNNAYTARTEARVEPAPEYNQSARPQQPTENVRPQQPSYNEPSAQPHYPEQERYSESSHNYSEPRSQPQRTHNNYEPQEHEAEEYEDNAARHQRLLREQQASREAKAAREQQRNNYAHSSGYAPNQRPAPERAQNPQPRNQGMGLLNIFGKPKQRPAAHDDYVEQEEPQTYNEENTDDYSIPAFLRRQAN